MRAEIRYLTDDSGRRWHLPIAIGPDDQFSIEWGDPPIIEIRRPLPKRWWERQSYDVLVLQLRPETDSDVVSRAWSRYPDNVTAARPPFIRTEADRNAHAVIADMPSCPTCGSHHAGFAIVDRSYPETMWGCDDPFHTPEDRRP